MCSRCLATVRGLTSSAWAMETLVRPSATSRRIWSLGRRVNYRQNYDQLVQVKRKYDPSNLFHINQNITP